MAAFMQLHVVTREQYDAGTPVDTSLYFVTGENIIYRGTELYTNAVEFYTDTLPTSPAPNRLYIDTTTLAGKMYDKASDSWKDVIKPAVDTVSADGTNPITGAAVHSFVQEQISAITGDGGVVLTGATWDPENYIFTFTKGDGTSENVTLTGVGVNLSYNNETGVLELIGADGNTVGSGVNLALEKFVRSGEYDDVNKNIILYFDDAKTEKVEIPVGDLIDEYSGTNTSTITLTIDGHNISADVKVSTEAGNVLEIKEDGLYVAETDISGKADKDTDATEGNIAVFDAEGNPVDSGKNFEDITPNNKILVSDVSLEDAITGTTPAKGDVAIVRKEIGTDTGKYEITVYVFDGEAWKAEDASYNAENVYFAEDLLTTYAMGNIKLTNGQAVIPAAGKNLKQVFDSIYVTEKNPTITQPSVSTTLTGSGAKEVGTVFTPSYSATLSTGKYEFGPVTGITATSWAVTDTDGHSATTNTGSFDAFTVEDDTNYKVTATATYDAGAIPVTNVGNAYNGGQIAAGSKSGNSSAVTGYRNTFYGTTSDKNDITSDTIRGLAGKSGKALANGATFSISVPVGALRVIFAYPATLRDVSSVINVNGMNAESKTAFTLNTLDVEGLNNYTAISYKVYVLEFANANPTANTYKVTI